MEEDNRSIDRPERSVLPTNLNDIFASWMSANGDLDDRAKVTPTFPPMYARNVVLYDHDHWTYRSTVERLWIRGGPQVELKLSSDGFIYPPRDVLSINPAYDSNAPHHRRTGRVQLSRETVSENFPSILAGCKTILGDILGVGKGEFITGKVLYHEREERVDFLFENEDGSSRILVTFEPGYPEHFHTNDPWDRY